MQRIEFTEEMIERAITILDRRWVRSVFDLAHLSAYLVVREEYPDIIFVCSDRLIDVAREMVGNEFVIAPENAITV